MFTRNLGVLFVLGLVLMLNAITFIGQPARADDQNPVIVDPAQAALDNLAELRKMPGINPDFIIAMEKEVSLIMTGNVDTIDQYMDNPGDYIPMYGTPKLAQDTPTPPVVAGIPAPDATETQNEIAGTWILNCVDGESRTFSVTIISPTQICGTFPGDKDGLPPLTIYLNMGADNKYHGKFPIKSAHYNTDTGKDEGPWYYNYKLPQSDIALWLNGQDSLYFSSTDNGNTTTVQCVRK